MADNDTEPDPADGDPDIAASSTGDDPADTDQTDGDPPVPTDVIDRAVTLTRRIRRAVDENERAAYREDRDRLLAAHGYEARVRDDDTGETLVLYPAEWLADGTVQVAAIQDTDRAVERSLSGVGSDEYDAVEAHNRAVADRVADRHGDPHGATAHAFADFMSNHYKKRIEAATPDERREFREEYFPRNAWPTDAQRDAVETSLALVVDVAGDE